jgi:uncharacterized membrane protein (Fun14 family)
MSLETSITSALFTAGSGGVIGFLIGFALKRVMKIMAVVVGLFLGGLMYLQTESIIGVNWAKLQSFSESALSIIGNSITAGHISNISGILGILLTGGLSAGLVLGFTKG